MIHTNYSTLHKKRVRDVESHNRGFQCENKVKVFLEDNNVPYWMNVRVRDGSMNVTEYDFIIPGATIECKYDFKSSKIADISKQISTQLKLSGDSMLYIYFLNATIEQIKLLDDHLLRVPIDKKRVKIISDLNDLLIHKTIDSYVFIENNTLYPFLNNSDKKSSVCYVEKTHYYKLKLIIDDDDKLFDDYKIVLFEGKKIRPCQALNQQLDGYNDILEMTNNVTVILRSKAANSRILVTEPSKLKYLFGVFHKLSPIDPTFMSNKYPNKIIKDISTLCVCGTHNIFCNSRMFDKCCETNKKVVMSDDEPSEKKYKRARIADDTTLSHGEHFNQVLCK